MSAVPHSLEARLEPLDARHLDAVLTIEHAAYEHPWSRGNFQDSLRSGHHARALLGGDQLLGYYVAMQGVDEVHLLNITVAPAFQRQGWARLMLDALALWSRQIQAQWLWLEVRVSNTRAIQLYETHGYRRVGLRKAYYPNGPAPREDAVVMSLRL
jgi:ribosomal-protein-alanine N-acetyltransferase